MNGWRRVMYRYTIKQLVRLGAILAGLELGNLIISRSLLNRKALFIEAAVMMIVFITCDLLAHWRRTAVRRRDGIP